MSENDVLCVESDFSSYTVTHIIAGGKEVGGVTSLGDDVFVVRHHSQEKIEAYDANTFTLQRHITVPGLGNYCYGLAACAYNNCLYASDFVNDSVHRVDLSGSNAVMKWSVASGPRCLSVNSEHNLLIVCGGGEPKLQIITDHGTVQHEHNIQLQADIEYPRHAVQLSTGQFLLSHSLHHVCLVEVDGVVGAVVRSYGEQKGTMRLSEPSGLAVDGEGRVLVANWGNNRLLVIDQSLSSARDMSVGLCVEGGLKGPFSLWYDQSRSRLYIGEWGVDHEGRVIVITICKASVHNE